MTEQNGHLDADLLYPGRFSDVAQSLRDGEPARAFAKAAETCLDKFELLAGKAMPPYAVLKLAIEFHKHALFCEVAQDKARTQHDAAAFAAYQAYLAGDTDVPVAMNLPIGHAPSAAAPTPDVDIDEEMEDAEGQ